MIKLTEGGLLDCYPDKEALEIVALSYALQQAIGMVIKYADEARVYCAIEQLPEKILDVLAVEMHSPYYDQSLPKKKKVEIIKNTLQWYMKAGTPSAVEELIQIVFGGGNVIEWFDYDEGPYTHGTFDIKTDVKMTEDLVKQFTKTIKRVKNTRSHVRKFIIIRRVQSELYCAAALRITSKCVITNHFNKENTHYNKLFLGEGIVQNSHQTIFI